MEHFGGLRGRVAVIGQRMRTGKLGGGSMFSGGFEMGGGVRCGVQGRVVVGVSVPFWDSCLARLSLCS